MKKRKQIGSVPVRASVLLNGQIVGYVENFSYEEQYPRDTLFHPSPSLKRLEAMIIEDDYNPSRRKQKNIEQILDGVDFDNENDT